ncbi:MAG: hypothetical protein NTV05_08085 [Acidobacteria bacterium]|nr:hypothetical protein [Acidobacteriota bacterium]
MKKMILAAIVLLIAAPAAFADTYIKAKTHTDGMAMMGQNTPARDDTNETWITAGKFATGNADAWFVIDVSKKVAYFIDHQRKTYVETPLPLDFAKLLPPEAAGMADMMKVTATVTPTSETKKIGSWDCIGYDTTMSVMGMKMNVRVWASTAVPFDVAAFNATIMPVILQGQMRVADASLAEFAKIKGFQIASELTADMMGAKMRVTQEVVDIAERPAPAGIYAPPDGYKKNATLSMSDLQKR